DASAIVPAARMRLGQIDPAVPLIAPQTGAQVIGRQTAQRRFVAVLLSGLAAVGFLLAMSGVYGAVALSVARRRREIGLRMPPGASVPKPVLSFVVPGMRPVLAGAVAGLVVIWFAAPYLKALLFRVTAYDPLSAISGLVLVLLTATAAAIRPAGRIGRLDPASTLRNS